MDMESSAKRKQPEPDILPGSSPSKKQKLEPAEPVDESAQSELVLENLKSTRAMSEERNGQVEFRVIDNDGSNISLILLTGLKCIFQKQLPNMPREYISRLVFDK